MIERYSRPEMARWFTDACRFELWLEVELAACEAMEAEGSVPAGTAMSIRKAQLHPNPTRINELEQTTRHDVIAFLTHIEELAGPAARFLHLGMTSSDVVDTALALQMTRASGLIKEDLQS